MIIESIELANVGPFREPVVLGPLTTGLNILAQPNETGKTTVVKALTRALFDRYSSGAKEIKQLQPAGSSLCPQTSVVFASGGVRYRLEKCFLNTRKSELARWTGSAWERIAESDQADTRVRELLGSSLPGSGVTKPEHWGLFRYLWPRQGDLSEWPCLDDEMGQLARSKLVTIDLDVKVSALVAQLTERWEKLFTATGRARAGGPLDLAEKAAAQLESQLAGVRERRAELEGLQESHMSLAAEVTRLQAESGAAKEEAKRLFAQAQEVEKTSAALVALKKDLTYADEKLRQVKRDRDELAESSRSMANATRLADQHAEAVARLTGELLQLERKVWQAQAETESHAEAGRVANARAERVHGLLHLRRLDSELATLRVRESRAQVSQAELVRLAAANSRLPKLTAGRLQEWRGLDRRIHELQTRLDAAGLTVTLAPERDAQLHLETDTGVREVSITAGERETMKAAQRLSVEIAGWGRIEITSGATEIAQLSAELAASRKQLRISLEEIGLTSLEHAEEALQQRREIEQQIQAARVALETRLGGGRDSPGALTAGVERLEQELANRRAALSPTVEEDALSLPALEAEEQTVAALTRAAGDAQKRLADQLASHRQALDKARAELAEGSCAVTALRERVNGFEASRISILQRHPDGMEAAFEDAQREFTRAEARLAEMARQLPPGTDQLPERSRRAARAAADLEAEWQTRAQALQRLQIQLEERGGEGLYAKEVALEEKLADVAAEAARLRREGLAHRLLCELIKAREEAAVKSVLKPLEDRLSATFAEITGISTRRVWLNEELQIEGVGPRSDELVSFYDLSQGAKEQLLLALRSAIALELSKSEPQFLILDDVLVNTDAARQRKVLDHLQALAGHVQILVLTCHQDRYRGIGHALTMRTASRHGVGGGNLSRS